MSTLRTHKVLIIDFSGLLVITYIMDKAFIIALITVRIRVFILRLCALEIT